MPPTNLSKKVLTFLVASYAVTNFILIVMSLVTYHKTRKNSPIQDCTFEGRSCNMANWAIYPLIAVAAFNCFLTASIMAFNMLVRAKDSVVDPLYVFRGILVTLLVLTPIVATGWVRPSMAMLSGKMMAPGSHPPITGGPMEAPLNPTTGLFSILGGMGTFIAVQAGRESSAEALHKEVGGHFGSIIGLTGAFILRVAERLPGASTVALSHFNM
ncbi:hypothetical protein E4U43_000821 [Claviceps pusilla]|uniref:Uncharacterized protein n=1 Tax=Claviceps pusilla TaxID=123648 RepID=A0A9P7NA27_9HYPO|nr:hypothetical protein E4U43_000821 [Claviceps pusilla]